MPTLEQVDGPKPEPEPLTRLPFGPLSRRHILHCSYDYWHPRYRSSVLKSRIISLSPEFLSYLREDGIVLPASETVDSNDYNDTGTSDGWDEDRSPDPSLHFQEIHQQIKDAIKDLGGLVAPKLNWSSPKDATWISVTKNSMECATPNDIYLLLKSSDFVTHDLEHAYEDCEEDHELRSEEIKYVLILRKWFKVNPSCEFRCFVRDRRVIGICQRDLNHFDFLANLQPRLQDLLLNYFEQTLRETFPDPSFVFDAYIPDPYDRVRLVDINPWAPRTDPLLFSWLELLTLEVPQPLIGIPETDDTPFCTSSSDEDTPEEGLEVIWKPEFRLVGKDDPEAYSFSTPQYSAHKIPKDVVDASLSGDTGMREFADQWKRMLDGDFEMQSE